MFDGSKFKMYILASIGISVGGWMAQKCNHTPDQNLDTKSMMEKAMKQAKEEADLVDPKVH